VQEVEIEMGKIRKNPPKHKWTKKKDGTYKSNYSMEELNKYKIPPPTKKKKGFI